MFLLNFSISLSSVVMQTFEVTLWNLSSMITEFGAKMLSNKLSWRSIFKSYVFQLPDYEYLLLHFLIIIFSYKELVIAKISINFYLFVIRFTFERIQLTPQTGCNSCFSANVLQSALESLFCLAFTTLLINSIKMSHSGIQFVIIFHWMTIKYLASNMR